jgi:hypothetical protein
MPLIPDDLYRRMAALDDRCDFHMDRRVRTPAENAGRAFRFWRVVIGPHGTDLTASRGTTYAPFPENGPLYVACEGIQLADTLQRAVEMAEERWPKA